MENYELIKEDLGTGKIAKAIILQGHSGGYRLLSTYQAGG
jgi:hypothetical protein